MKLEFQAKFLQYLNKRNQQDEGFTLIELLVVIIIIGILAAIALPSLISQSNKAKQAEARQNVGALNRAQQAFYLEQNAFSTDITTLGVGISSQTVNYKYKITGSGGTDPQIVGNIGSKIKGSLKSYMGLNWTQAGGGGGGAVTEPLSFGKVCETNAIKDNINEQPPTARDNTGALGCPLGYKDLSTGVSK